MYNLEITLSIQNDIFFFGTRDHDFDSWPCAHQAGSYTDELNLQPRMKYLNKHWSESGVPNPGYSCSDGLLCDLKQINSSLWTSPSSSLHEERIKLNDL